MPTRIKLASTRLILCKLTMRLMQLAGGGYMDMSKFGSTSDDTILLMAAFIGHAERRPMTAAKLATYAGLPRPTVARKLKQLEQRGLLRLEGGGVVLVIDLLNRPETVEAVEAGARAVRKAAAELSKLDSKAIANHGPPS